MHNLNDFGSACGELIGSDFTLVEQLDLNIHKEILWCSADTPDTEVNRREADLIRHHGSNNPEIGYNKWRLFKDGAA